MATVLLVDDHDDLRASLTELLRLDGWKALAARSVDEAVTIAQGAHIDIVLTDVLLLRQTGLHLKMKFAADPNLSGIPFVFMTGHPGQVEELAPDCVLLKPFSMELLGETLAQALSRRQ